MGYRDTDYASSSDLKAYIGVSDTVDDAQVALAVTSASRAIDRHCGRAFGVDDSATTREYGEHHAYREQWPFRLRVFEPHHRPHDFSFDDISTATGLVVQFADSDDWAPSYTTLTIDDDFRLLPVNLEGGWPYTGIELNPSVYRYGVARFKVTATYGWPSVPDAVKQAALIQAARFLQRRDSPFGVVGSPDVNGGNVLELHNSLDPDVAQLLRTFIRRWAAA